MPADRPTVDVIDDDEAVRDSLALVLGSAGIAVRTHVSAAAFLAALPKEPADCIVTDVRMPGVSGIDLLRELRALGVHTPVIVMTGHGDVPLAVEAMKLGAVDFLEKPFEEDALLAAVRGALQDQEKAGEREALRDEIAQRLAKLSERERQVLAGLVAGSPNKTIAFDLGISPRTVEVYRANLMTKMKAGSLSELVRMALIAGPLD